jgi:hypothetical protein
VLFHRSVHCPWSFYIFETVVNFHQIRVPSISGRLKLKTIQGYAFCGIPINVTRNTEKILAYLSAYRIIAELICNFNHSIWMV